MASSGDYLLACIPLQSFVQVAQQMGRSKVETTKNINGHLFAQDRTAILDGMNQAVSRLHLCESADNGRDRAV